MSSTTVSRFAGRTAVRLFDVCCRLDKTAKINTDDLGKRVVQGVSMSRAAVKQC